MGGAEKMALEIIKTLENNGYQVHLYTIDETDWQIIENKWGKYSRPSEEHAYIKEKLDPRSLYSWMKTLLIYLYILLKTYLNYQVTINNYGEIIPYLSEITYFHAEPLYQQKNNPYYIPFWEFIKPIYEKSSNYLNKKYCNGVFITNSKYNADKIEALYQKHAKIIYPFIEPITYYDNIQKTGNILIISRLTPGKNLKTIVPLVCSLKKLDFILMGQTTLHSGKIQNILRDFNNITIVKNPSREKYEDIIKKSSIVLGTQPNEAFGISLLEAMSAGCIPIIYRGGGPWVDVFEKKNGVYGYSYRTTEEAEEMIRFVLSNGSERETLRENSIKRANQFNEYQFKAKILKIVEETYNSPINKLDLYHKINSYKKQLSGYRNKIKTRLQELRRFLSKKLNTGKETLINI